MKHNITIEICAGSLEDVLTASKVSEADRIELNCALELGGLTPSLMTLIKAKQLTDKKIIAMVRPRGAGFIYSENEKNVMYEDAKIFLQNGADGIVFGSLRADHTVDLPFTEKMCDLIHAYKKEAVFHKAFDDAADQMIAARDLIECGVDRILTSGAEPDALKGAEKIRQLNALYGSKITFLPGGGVSETNVSEILRMTGSKEIHMSAKITVDQDGQYYAVSKERIENILRQI